LDLVVTNIRHKLKAIGIAIGLLILTVIVSVNIILTSTIIMRVQL